MNSLIETLNLWGEHLLVFAGPLLWQSSLLIAVLYGFDLAFRRRLRAAIRYALWLVVLVKLVLPPSLALPTGLVWWFQPRTAPPAKPQPSFVVTYGNNTMPTLPRAVVPAYAPPPPRFSAEGWMFAAWAGVSLALLGWMGVRWLSVARDIRCATPGEPWLDELLATTRSEASLRREVRLRLTNRPMSPAVCGLIRPVILLPHALVAQLPPAQLRAVLLHELVHLRRGDVWVNCLQALLQIAYWWHPLVWLANARIRCVREEAVDDAVMLALRDDAEHYAPTLLEVAKLAFRRPLASLGLVGILESRSALRQRIERLVNFQPPRRAELSVVAGLGVAAFAAVAVPMGEPPAKPDSNRTNVTPVSVTAQSQGPALDSLRVLQPQLTSAAFDNVRSAIETTNSAEQIQDLRDKIPVLGDLPWLGRFFRSEPDASFYDPLTGLSLLSSAPFHGSPSLSSMSLTTRVFRFDGEAFDAAIRKRTGLSDTANSGQLAQAFYQLLIQLGIDFQPPKTFYLSGTIQKARRLLVRVTDPELEAILAFLVELGFPTSGPSGRTNESPGGTSRTSSSAAGPKPNTAILLQDAKLLYELGKFDEVEKQLQRIATGDPNKKTADYYLGLVQQARARAAGRHEGDPDNSSASAWTNLVYIAKGRQRIISKLDQIRLDRVAYDSAPLGEVINNLYQGSKGSDSTDKGINFILNPTLEASSDPEPEVTVALPAGRPAIAVGKTDLSSLPITISPPLINVRLGDVLDAVVKASPTPIHYSIEEYAIVIAPGPKPQPLTTRVFKVDPSTFYQGLENVGALSPEKDAENKGSGERFGRGTNGMAEVSASCLAYFLKLGVDLTPPKTLFWNDRAGKLIVRATAKDLDVIQSAIEILNEAPAQIQIVVKFIELPEDDCKVLLVRLTPASNALAGGFTGILTPSQAREVLKDLEGKSGVDVFSGPSVTTVAGRQAQIQAVDMKTIVTGLTGVVTNGATNFLYQTETIPFGPTLDVLPSVSADGYTISMTVLPTVTEFMGYDDPKGISTNLVNGPLDGATLPLPVFRVQQITTSAVLWDGQTLVLGNFPDRLVTRTSDGREEAKENSSAKRKQLLVFVTPTLVDPAGNRVHPD